MSFCSNTDFHSNTDLLSVMKALLRMSLIASCENELMPRLLGLVCLLGIVGASPLHAQTPISFPEQVAPILQKHCVACHGAKRAEGGYRLDTVEHMLKPGDGANLPVVPQKSSDSEWVQRLRSHDSSLRMPAESEPLGTEQIDAIARWMDEGANLEGVDTSAPLWLVIPPARDIASPEHYPHAIPVTAMAFAADGAQLITSGYHEALVWNPVPGELIDRLPNQVQRAFAILPLHQGKTLAIAGGTPGAIGEVRLFEREGRSVQQVLARSNDVVTGLCLASWQAGDRSRAGR
jgi:hypothetical protein